MKIVVCPLSKVRDLVEVHSPERVISLLDPEFAFPDLGSPYRDRHLRLHLHDIHEPAPQQIVPANAHVDQLLEFVSSWKGPAPILIHCRAGISRSSAAAFITACLHCPDLRESDIARAMTDASPLARPNELLVHLADAAMRRSGRMLEAIRNTGRNLTWAGVDENNPFELPVALRSSA